jgi:hypothetical protein
MSKLFKIIIPVSLLFWSLNLNAQQMTIGMANAFYNKNLSAIDSISRFHNDSIAVSTIFSYGDLSNETEIHIRMKDSSGVTLFTKVFLLTNVPSPGNTSIMVYKNLKNLYWNPVTDKQVFYAVFAKKIKFVEVLTKNTNGNFSIPQSYALK